MNHQATSAANLSPPFPKALGFVFKTEVADVDAPRATSTGPRQRRGRFAEGAAQQRKRLDSPVVLAKFSYQPLVR